MGVPIPRPIATLGDAAASVTVTVPCCATVNVDRLEPCTPTVPPNVSFELAGEDGVSGEVTSFRRLQAPLAKATTIANAIAIDRFRARRMGLDSDMRMIVGQRAL